MSHRQPRTSAEHTPLTEVGGRADLMKEEVVPSSHFSRETKVYSLYKKSAERLTGK